MIRPGDWVRVKPDVDVSERYAHRLEHGKKYEVHNVSYHSLQNLCLVTVRCPRMGGFAMLSDLEIFFELVTTRAFSLDSL